MSQMDAESASRTTGVVPSLDKLSAIHVTSVVPKKRHELLNWYGWGYKDSRFQLTKEGAAVFTGSRYNIQQLPYFVPFVRHVFNVDTSKPTRQVQPLPVEDDYPSRMEGHMLDELKQLGIELSVCVIERIGRAHGQTLHDIKRLREGKFERIPDAVLWPRSHAHVVTIVQFAHENDMVIIPFGGGTAVSGATECPSNEVRPIISLDTSQMNRILWVDRENLVACCESGIIGQDLERELGRLGFTCGHEPDSYEFSTLGGWVATRASGMKKNVYGNIEDLVVHVRMVTPMGVLERSCQVPRISCGPDFQHLILGSEGCLGVITDVVIKIRPIPQFRRFGSIVFPDFESGVNCMRHIAKERCQPASLRLMDNVQFQFGQSLKSAPTRLGSLADSVKKYYLTWWKGYDMNDISVMTMLFEGDRHEVEAREKKIYEIAAKYGGLCAGESNGMRGYTLTFIIAYIRDLACDYNIVAESFETSVSWDRALSLCRNVKHRVRRECDQRGITNLMISCRVTQTYDAGCVVYFYFAFRYEEQQDPVQMFADIENSARDEILASGGSVSHHHGVGKLRKKWYPQTVSEVGVGLFHAAKLQLDPRNVFAIGNLVEAKL